MASTIVLPLSRTATRAIARWFSVTKRSIVRSSRRRAPQVEPAHTACATRARATAAATSSADATGSVPSMSIEDGSQQ